MLPQTTISELATSTLNWGKRIFSFKLRLTHPSYSCVIAFDQKLLKASLVWHFINQMGCLSMAMSPGCKWWTSWLSVEISSRDDNEGQRTRTHGTLEGPRINPKIISTRTHNIKIQHWTRAQAMVGGFMGSEVVQTWTMEEARVWPDLTSLYVMRSSKSTAAACKRSTSRPPSLPSRAPAVQHANNALNLLVVTCVIFLAAFFVHKKWKKKEIPHE